MTTNRLLARCAALIAAGLLVLSACGDDTVEVTSSDGSPDGRTFWSTSVTEGGADRPLVEGTRLSLSFGDDLVRADAGCNTMSGSYTIDDAETLTVTELSATEIGCEPALADQDQFVADLLLASPTMTVEGDELVLVGGDLTIRFIDRSVADPDRPLVATEWTVTGFLDGEVAMSFFTGQDGSLVFGDDGSVSGFDGCQELTLTFEEENGRLTWGDYEAPDLAVCSDTTEYATRVNQVFATGGADYSIDGPNLTILNDDDQGVTLRAPDVANDE